MLHAVHATALWTLVSVAVVGLAWVAVRWHAAVAAQWAITVAAALVLLARMVDAVAVRTSARWSLARRLARRTQPQRFQTAKDARVRVLAVVPLGASAQPRSYSVLCAIRATLTGQCDLPSTTLTTLFVASTREYEDPGVPEAVQTEAAYAATQAKDAASTASRPDGEVYTSRCEAIDRGLAGAFKSPAAMATYIGMRARPWQSQVVALHAPSEDASVSPLDWDGAVGELASCPACPGCAVLRHDLAPSASNEVDLAMQYAMRHGYTHVALLTARDPATVPPTAVSTALDRALSSPEVDRPGCVLLPIASAARDADVAAALRDSSVVTPPTGLTVVAVGEGTLTAYRRITHLVPSNEAVALMHAVGSAALAPALSPVATATRPSLAARVLDVARESRALAVALFLHPTALIRSRVAWIVHTVRWSVITFAPAVIAAIALIATTDEPLSARATTGARGIVLGYLALEFVSARAWRFPVRWALHDVASAAIATCTAALVMNARVPPSAVAVAIIVTLAGAIGAAVLFLAGDRLGVLDEDQLETVRFGIFSMAAGTFAAMACASTVASAARQLRTEFVAWASVTAAPSS